jgi:hypothetical protein
MIAISGPDDDVVPSDRCLAAADRAATAVGSLAPWALWRVDPDPLEPEAGDAVVVVGVGVVVGVVEVREVVP